ncbi:MAG TPA: NAD(P)H-dependent oxidoreductase [Methylomirabilota bacterium]|nr:NAD(P)H-dependent oxidoreductase [Methylomirabilota bacterium]
MNDSQPHVLAVIGSQNQDSTTRVVVLHLAEQLRADGCAVDVFDYLKEPLALFNTDTSYTAPSFASLRARVEAADVLLLGTPDYHGGMSSAMKNFLDHFWREFAGKLFATVVASHEKGLTVTDQLRTVARQCYAWSMPYAVSFSDQSDVQDGKIADEKFGRRLEMFARDIRVYGRLLAGQRRADLAGTDPGFLARYRSKGVTH